MENKTSFFKTAIPEIILLLLVWTGIFFKILHLSFGNLMLTIFMMLLAGLYLVGGSFIFSGQLPSSVFLEIKGSSVAIRRGFSFVAGIFMACLVMAYWEWNLHLPLYKMMFIVSIFLFIILSLAAIILGFTTDRGIFKIYLRVWVSLLLLNIPHLILAIVFGLIFM